MKTETTERCAECGLPNKDLLHHPDKLAEMGRDKGIDVSDFECHEFKPAAAQPEARPVPQDEQLGVCEYSKHQHEVCHPHPKGSDCICWTPAAQPAAEPSGAREFLESRGLADLSLYWPTGKPLPQIHYESGEPALTLIQLMEAYAEAALAQVREEREKVKP
jgi:hypothetical protein